MPTMLTVVCAECGKEFERELKSINRTIRTGNNTLCSRECSYAHRRGVCLKSRDVPLEKLCSMCNVIKPINAFNKDKTHRDGRNYICRICSRAHGRDYYASYSEEQKQVFNNKRRYKIQVKRGQLLHYLATHPCIDCGETNPVMLDFDHVRGTKNREISYMTMSGHCWSTILKEIEKCEVRCANCHRAKTAKEFNWYAKHIPYVLHE